MEQWKEIEGFEGYEVSCQGRVRSFRRPGTTGLRKEPKIIKPWSMNTQRPASRGKYVAVSLCKDGKPIKQQVHRLVAQVFLPNPENKPQVNHKNGIKNDNRLENLEWCTNKENHDHARKNNLLPEGWIKRQQPKKLDDVKVLTIWTVHDVQYGRTWRHITCSLR